jgi:hypothetical protein
MTARDEAKTYTFTHEGKSYSVPAFGDLPMGALRMARKASDDGDKAFIILEYLLGEDSKEIKAIDSMNAAEFSAWIDGWTKGAPLGESLSSES